ncbi:MAG: hypothetical protein ACAH11_10820 [Sphingomonas sp.]
MIKLLLVVTGILALIAIGVRSSVLIGLYLGVLPGLVLAVAPTIFVYLAAFAIIRKLLPFSPGIAANLWAGAAVFALSVAIALPMALAGRAAFAAAATGDVVPAQPVKIAGHVRLERLGRTEDASYSNSRDNTPPPCTALCAALLDTPGVLSVTLTGSDFAGKPIAPITYRLVPKTQAPGASLAPLKPENIVGQLPEPKREGNRNFDVERAERELLANSINARWATRLATEESLIAEPARATADMVITLKELRAEGTHRIAITETEVRDARGIVLLRRQRVTAAPVASIFYLAPEGPMMDKGFGIGRSTLHTGGRWDEVKTVQALFAGTFIARPQADPHAVEKMRDRLAAAAAGTGPRADLSMVAPWLVTLDWTRLTDGDVDLLSALLADTSIGGLDKIYDGYAKHVSPRLRRSIVIRLSDPRTEGSFRYRLNDMIRRMPAGTFATLLPEEEALLRDRKLRLQSSALVMRVSDGGAKTVPLLIALLREDVQVENWYERQWMMADLRRAFARLGRDAAPALPLVEQLFNQPRNPLANEWREAQAWRVTMVRMGKPVETLTFPANLRPEQVAEDRANVAKAAARPIDPDRDD